MNTRYCGNCCAVQHTLELAALGQTEVRCAVCGFTFADAKVLTREIPARGELILCIDDDPVIRQLLTFTLEGKGFVPLTAANGPTGLTMAAAERPRLILVDIMMPGMDGYEVCRRLKANPRTAHIPLIVLTAQTDAKLNVKAFQAGADLALTKPFQPDRLIAILRAALALRSRASRGTTDR